MASADVDLFSRPYDQDPSALDPVRPHAGENAAVPRDELDDLFNYDAQIGDVFRDVEQNDTVTAPSNGNNRLRAGAEEVHGLGIDDEVKIRKPRAPIAKLDEERLLSDKGIPALRGIAKRKLKFRGKGHEFSDVARLLNTYQLWLDDLFPKAQFADGLVLIEKLGHKKRMHVMRKAWIDEEKPKPAARDYSDDDDVIAIENDTAHDSIFVPDDNQMADENVVHADHADSYTEPSPVPQPNPTKAHPQISTIEDQPEEDELDALMAEDATRELHLPEPPSQKPHADAFEDEMEAMADMDW